MKKRIMSFLMAVLMLAAMVPTTAWGISIKTDASTVSGSDYTSSPALASALNTIFAGNASVYSNPYCTDLVNTALGTRNVPEDSPTQYVGSYGSYALNSGSSCWIYANGVYYTLFGEALGNGDPGSRSISLDLSSGSRSISYANFCTWGVRAGVGAQVCVANHSFVILSYDEKQLTYLDGNGDGHGLVAIRAVGWNELPSCIQGTVHYIIQPTDNYYYSKYPEDRSYISQCTSYPSYAIIKATKATTVKTLPCSAATSSESHDICVLSTGDTLTATAIYRNSAGNYWYKVSANGQTGYVYAGETSVISLKYDDVTISSVSAPTAIKVGNTFSIKGEIRSKYNIITTVAGYISGTQNYSGNATVNGTYYSLYNSPIDAALLFNYLQTGNYTYKVTATLKNCHSTDGKSLQTQSYTKTLVEQAFTVGSPSHIHNYNTVKSNDLYHWSECSCGATVGKAEHTYDNWFIQQDATCTTDGIRARKCPGCYHTLTEPIPATGHNFDNGTARGDTILYTCCNCGITETSSAFIYTLRSDGTTISIDTYRGENTYISIPNEIDGYAVVEIGDYAFAEKEIKSIEIPSGVTVIGCNAFSGCTNLRDIKIPDSVSEIYDFAFSNCPSLKYLKLPSSLNYLGEGVFAGSLINLSGGNSQFNTRASYGLLLTGNNRELIYNSGNDFYIPNHREIQVIRSHAFEKPSQSNLNTDDTLIIPEGVVFIGSSCFKNCQSLVYVFLPSSIKYIEADAFLGCDNLQKVVYAGDITEWQKINIAAEGNDAFLAANRLYNGNSDYEYEFLEDGTVDICSYCGPNGDVRIPETICGLAVSRVSYHAFSYSNIGKLTIPSGIRYISADSFAEGHVESFSVDSRNLYYNSDSDGVLYTKDRKSLVAYPNTSPKTAYSIPEGVTKVCDSAFLGCSNLTSITLPNSLTEIDARGFQSCSNLKEIQIPGGVKKIGWVAFSWCNNLETVTLGEGVTEIANQAFDGCRKMTSITLPKSIAKIGGIAFHNCPNLKDIYYQGTPADWQKIDFGSDNEDLLNATIHCAAGLGIPTITLTTASNGNPVIKWTKVNSAAQYEVYRSDTGKDNSFKIIRRTAGLTYTDTNTVAGKTYYYVVRAIDGSTTGKFCAARSIAVPGALGVPTITLTTASNGNPVIKWTKVNSAAQYEVYRSDTGKDNSFKIIRRTAGLTFTDTAAAAGKTYYYVVRAINGSIAGKFCAAKSVAVSGALGEPTMTLKLGSDGKPVVSWTKVNGAAQYEVYRSETGKANTFRIIRRTAGLTYTDTAAAAGKTYYYVVRAINGSTAGKFCAAQMVLGVPTMTLTSTRNGTVIQWTKVDGAAQYEVYRSDTGKANTFKIIRRTADTFWEDDTAVTGSVYYTVRAMRGSGTSLVYGGFCSAATTAHVETAKTGSGISET